MSGFASPLWLLGLSTPGLQASADVGMPVVGINGPAFALPSRGGAWLPRVPLPAAGGDTKAALALPPVGSVRGARAALPVLTGVTYG